MEGWTALALAAKFARPGAFFWLLNHKQADPERFGQLAVEQAKVSEDSDIKAWGHSYGRLFGRYTVEPGPSVHLSSSAKVQFAKDVAHEDCSVCLKWMKHRENFEAEINARHINGVALDTSTVIALRGWHTPESEPLSSAAGQSQEAEHTDSAGDEYPYLLVLERGERSLHDACAKERVAGYNLPVIRSTFSSIARCVQSLHSNDVVHGDLKQRNILRIPSQAAALSTPRRDMHDPPKGPPRPLATSTSRVKSGATGLLCDMDASARIKAMVGGKSSSAYAPPELARISAHE